MKRLLKCLTLNLICKSFSVCSIIFLLYSFITLLFSLSFHSFFFFSCLLFSYLISSFSLLFSFPNLQPSFFSVTFFFPPSFHLLIYLFFPLFLSLIIFLLFILFFLALFPSMSTIFNLVYPNLTCTTSIYFILHISHRSRLPYSPIHLSHPPMYRHSPSPYISPTLSQISSGEHNIDLLPVK